MNGKVTIERRVQVANWIAESNAEWLARYKASTRKGIGEILDEAIEALWQKVPESRKLNF
jgi:hypothetical protein